MADGHVELRPAWRNYWVSLAFGTLAPLAVLVGAGMLLLGGKGLSNLDLAPLLIGAALIVLPVFVLLGAVLGRFSNKFTVDDGRVIQHEGILSRRQHSVRIRDLRSIELSQSLFQRLFGIGDLHFYSAGDEAEVRFTGVKDPAGLRAKIDAMADGE